MSDWFSVRMYLLKLKMFKWIVDKDGDIGIQIFGIVTLIKYKESTIIYWGRRQYQQAPKYVCG